MIKRKCKTCKKKLGWFEGKVCNQCGIVALSKKMYDYDARIEAEKRASSQEYPSDTLDRETPLSKE